MPHTVTIVCQTVRGHADSRVRIFHPTSSQCQSTLPFRLYMHTALALCDKRVVSAQNVKVSFFYYASPLVPAPINPPTSPWTPKMCFGLRSTTHARTTGVLQVADWLATSAKPKCEAHLPVSTFSFEDNFYKDLDWDGPPAPPKKAPLPPSLRGMSWGSPACPGRLSQHASSLPARRRWARWAG